MRYVPEALSRLIDAKLLEQPAVLVAVDGPCGGGKSTLGEALRAVYEPAGSALYHMDDFFLQPHMRSPERLSQPGGNVDYERFLAEVLEPIRRAGPFTYRRYDCASGTFHPVEAHPARVNVVEGAYSLHPRLREYYDLKVFLDIDGTRQLERLLGRVGPDRIDRFVREWIPLENRYFDALDIRGAADILLRAEG